MVDTADLKVYALRADDQACGMYRIEQPAEIARANGVDITVDTGLPADVIIGESGEIRIMSLDIDADVNVIVFQRPLIDAFVTAIEYAQARGIACVVELDDDLSSVEVDNQAYWSVNPETNPTANWEHLIEAARRADWVIASTPEIARRFAPHGRSSVVRNCLPNSIFDIKKTFPDEPRVGWTGWLGTHPHDLEVIGPHLATVLRNTGTGFSMLGNPEGVREQLYFDDSIKFEASPWVELDQYHKMLANTMDIGIVPLSANPFNKSKSYLKGLEMAGVGIPFIASATDEYRFLASLGAGRVAKKGMDWQKYIRLLVADRDYLLEESQRVRNAVRSLTYENHIGEWIDAWTSALRYRSRIM